MLPRVLLAGCLLLSISLARAEGLAVEFHHAGFGHFFVTAFPEEAAALDANPASGWARTGASFLVDTDADAGAAPVCRFFSAAFAPRSSHFYTPYADECAKVKGDATWTYEAVAFYLRLPDAAGACPAGTEVLYRLYNDGSTGAPNHRYTASPDVFNAFRAKGWIAEGHGVTGAFACTPARPTRAAAGNVTGVAELRSNVRPLADADAAELLSVTATTLTFAAAVSIQVGDIFVVNGVGVFRATSVRDVGGRRIVGVEAPTVDELFANLELAGTVPLSEGYFSEPAAQPLAGSSQAQGIQPRKFSAVGSSYKGAPGIQFSWTYDTYCSEQTNFSPFTVSVGIYGSVTVDYRKSRLQDAISISPAYVVPAATLKAGCRLKIPVKRFKVGEWSVPIFNGAFFIDIPIFVRIDAETDVGPIVTLAFGDVEFAIDTATNGVGSTIRGGAIDTTALMSLLAPGMSYSASATWLRGQATNKRMAT